MQKVDLNEGGAELPVIILHANANFPAAMHGFHFSFKGSDEVRIDDFVGPYPTREAALDAASKVAHEAVRAQATDELLSQNQGH